MDHSSLFLLLVYNLSLKQCQTWISAPTIHLVNYLIQICMCFSVRVNNLYPYKKQLYQQEDSTSTQFFCLQFQTLFISRVLRLAPFPSPSIEAPPYICNIVRLSFQSLNFIQKSYDPPKWFLKSIYNEIHSLCGEVLQVLTNPYCCESTLTVQCRQCGFVILTVP